MNLARIAVALFAIVGCSEPSAPPAARPLNVLLITLDTLRADYLGSYGHARPTSPELDALAASGVLFENAIAQSAVTPVSHASILTGLYPHHHGLRSLHGGKGFRLPAERVTLAEILAANGYTTAGFVSAFPATRHFGLDQGFATWNEDFGDEARDDLIGDAGIVNTGRAQRRADATTAEALRWLEAGRRDPFFLWIHYFDTHDEALAPPAEYVARFPARSVQRADQLRALYEAEVAYIDEHVGHVLRALERLGLRERTLVAVLADHGEGLGDHDWWGHSLLYQEQVRVPFLLSVPGSGWSGRVHDLVRSVDLVPTILDVLDIPCPDGRCGFDGSSLRGVIAGGTRAFPVAYSESLSDLAGYPGSPFANDSLYALNDGRWKLVARYEGLRAKPSWLFDLEADPGETVNLIHAHPDVERRLRRRLEALGSIVEADRSTPLDPSVRERLRSLGYLR